jgi:hypothetical protein
MKTSHFLRIMRNKAALPALFLFVFAPAGVFAQQMPPAADGTPTLPAYCNPLPEDLAQLQECNDLISQFNIDNYADTTDPVTGPGTGVRGMASAYNPTNNTVLFISTAVNGLDASIIGQFYDAETMQVTGGSFVIDQGRLASGSPRAVYNTVTNNFFVTWQDERPAPTRSSIYGRFVNPDGSMPQIDFSVYSMANNFIGDLTIDYTNRWYVQNFDLLPDGPRFITISFDGVPGNAVNLDYVPGNWEGHSSMCYNSNRNEYWYAYATVVSGGDTAREDGRIMFRRVDATTMQPVGEPIQLSQTRVGRNAFAHPQIACSAEDGAAVVAWQEMGRTPGMTSEVYGRTVYDDLTLSAEYPILTASTYSASDFYGAPRSLQYNPATGTYAMAVEDNNGGTTYVEFWSDGTILEAREIIPPSGQNGNFNPGLGSTGGGFVTFTSADYGRPTVTSYQSPYRGSPPRPVQPAGPGANETLDTTQFAETLSRVYLYALGLAGLLAVAMAVFGGYLVMMARGNAQQASKGRDFITSSLIGLVLLFAAFIILNTLNPDLTQLDVPSLQDLSNNPRQQ